MQDDRQQNRNEARIGQVGAVSQARDAKARESAEQRRECAEAYGAAGGPRDVA